MAIPLSDYEKIFNRPGRSKRSGDEGFPIEEDEAEERELWQKYREATRKDVYPATASPAELQEFLEWLVENN